LETTLNLLLVDKAETYLEPKANSQCCYVNSSLLFKQPEAHRKHQAKNNGKHQATSSRKMVNIKLHRKHQAEDKVQGKTLHRMFLFYFR